MSEKEFDQVHSVKSWPWASLCWSSSGSGSIRPMTSPEAMLSCDCALLVDANRGLTYAGGRLMFSPLLPRLDSGDEVDDDSWCGSGGRCAKLSGSRVLRPMVAVPELGARAVEEPVLLPVSLRLPPSPRILARNVSFISRRRSSIADAVLGRGSAAERVRDRVTASDEDPGAGDALPELEGASPGFCSRKPLRGFLPSISRMNAEMSSSSVFVVLISDAFCQIHHVNVKEF